MSDSGGDQSYRATLAREDGPVRRLLTRYFRRRIDNSDEVEDLVQDTFARVVARDSSEPIENLGGYLLRTAGSVLANRARRRVARRAESHIVFDPDRHGGEDVDPERALSARQELDAALAALLSLPERTRTVFLLFRLEGYRQREIAEHLGISLSTVEKDMVKAIRHLSDVGHRHGS
jgi:RNA polymerase sigma factor (sigma-70 family)